MTFPDRHGNTRGILRVDCTISQEAMQSPFLLAPRYRLDDESLWLEGIDPARRYWIAVNGESRLTIALPGVIVSSQETFKQVMKQFAALQPGEKMEIERPAQDCTLHCVGMNCYALEAEPTVWHLFDRETIESLLMTAHPDWKCATRDADLGRQALYRAWDVPVAA